MASSTKACTAALLLLLAAALAVDGAKNIASSRTTAMRPQSEDASRTTAMRPQSENASTTCVSSLLALSPCLPFFKDAGTSSAPEGCCAGLRGIIDDQALCLCHIVDHTLERAIGVDIPVDRAFTLVSDLCSLSLPQNAMDICSGGGAAMPPLYACPAPSV